MTLPGISNGHNFPGYDDHDEEEEQEDQAAGNGDAIPADIADEADYETRPRQREGPPVRRRRLLGSGGPRLPGLAELDRNIAADRASEVGGMFIKQEGGGRRIKLERDGRRGSGCSGGSSGGSRRSR